MYIICAIQSDFATVVWPPLSSSYYTFSRLVYQNIIDSGGGGDGVVSNPLLTSCILVLLFLVLAVRCIVIVCVVSKEVLLQDTLRRRIVKRGLQNIFGPRSRDATRHVTTNTVPLSCIETAQPLCMALTHARKPLIF